MYYYTIISIHVIHVYYGYTCITHVTLYILGYIPILYMCETCILFGVLHM